MKQIVFLATHWGTKYGGINAFNLDFCTAVSQTVSPETHQVVCIVLNADEKIITQAKQAGVELISLDIEKQEFEIPYAYQIKALLHKKAFDNIQWWIGHDVFSGPIALELRKIHDSHPSRVALIHHMDFGAYKIFQQTGQNLYDAQRKIEHQQKIFKKADTVFAVGPYLQKSAEDLCGKPVTALIPGLIENVGSSASSSLFNVITLGRLDPVNDIIKQLTLSVKAIGKAYDQYKQLSEIAEIPKMWVYGISEDADEFKKLLAIAQESAHARIPVNAFPYKENRQEVWSHMRGCNLCLMPSLHEGFGLVGWEAISLEVPLILSKHSGLFRLLYDLNATSYVQDIDITGILEQDTEPLAHCIAKVYFRKQEYKDKARELKQLLLDKRYTWKKTAQDFLEAIETKHNGNNQQNKQTANTRNSDKNPSETSTPQSEPSTKPLHIREKIVTFVSGAMFTKILVSSKMFHSDSVNFPVFIFALILLSVLLGIAFIFPQPTGFQYSIFRAVMALTIAIILAFIPRFLGLQLEHWVIVSGALAVFALIYLFDPVVISKRNNRTAPLIYDFTGYPGDYVFIRGEQTLPVMFFMPLQEQDQLIVKKEKETIQIKAGDKPVIELNTKNSPYTITLGKTSSLNKKLIMEIGGQIGDWHKDELEYGSFSLRIKSSSPSQHTVKPYIKLLENSTHITMGTRPLEMAWGGNRPPYQLAIHHEKQEVFALSDIQEQWIKTQALPLIPGSYRVVLTDAVQNSVSYSFTVVEASPVYPDELRSLHLPEFVRLTLQATWLAAQDKGIWKFEAYQYIADIAENYRPARLLRDALEQGEEVEVP